MKLRISRFLLLVLVGILYFFASNTFAFSFKLHPYVLLGAGSTNVGSNKDVTLETDPSPGLLINRYVTDSSSLASFLFGIGADRLYMKLPYDAELRFGGEFFYIRTDKLNGTVEPFINGGSFDTRRFSYRVDSFAWLAKVSAKKVNIFRDFSAYVDFGLGPSLNYASAYKERMINGSTSIPMYPFFQNGSTGKLGVSVGVSLTHMLSHDLEIMCGYRYINLGNAVLNRSDVHPSAPQRLISKDFGHNMFVVTVRR